MSEDDLRLSELQQKMTEMPNGTINPGAEAVFSEMYLRYGLKGIEAMHSAGYDSDIKVWDFYVFCANSFIMMALELNILV